MMATQVSVGSALASPCGLQAYRTRKNQSCRVYASLFNAALLLHLTKFFGDSYVENGLDRSAPAPAARTAPNTGEGGRRLGNRRARPGELERGDRPESQR